MKLQRGITSFFDWDERGLIPEIAFDDFKRAIFSAFNRDGWRVGSLLPRSGTPNFHTAEIVSTNESTLVVCNGTYPIYAFADTSGLDNCLLTFRDYPNLAERLKAFPNLMVASVSDLSRLITDADIANLDKCEAEQIKYWKPKTIGEIVFNWFD